MVAQRWVEANAHRLPTTLEGFAEFDLARRRAIFRAVSSKTRVRYWQQHLDKVLVENRGLTDRQRSFVVGEKARLPEYARLPPQGARLDVLEKRAVAVMGPELARAAFSFASLGGEAPSWVGVEGAWPECDCDDQGPSGDCDGAICDEGAICHPDPLGCGFLGLEACLGLCTGPPN